MSPKDLVDVFLSIRGSIYTYWNFYIIVVVAVFGWLASISRSLSLTLKVGLTVGLILFSAICVSSLVWNYSLLEAVRTDLCNHKDFDSAAPRLSFVVGRMSYGPHKILVWSVQGVVGALVLALLWRHK